MNRKSIATINRNLIAALLVAPLMLLVYSGAARAQDAGASTDQDNPTPLNGHIIRGNGVDEKTDYFYTFAAGPGEVKVKISVKSQKSAAVSSVDVDLLDDNSKRIVYGFANPSLGDSKQETLTARVSREQAVVLKVTVSPGVDSYSITVSGAVRVQSEDAASLRHATNRVIAFAQAEPPSRPQIWDRCRRA